MFRIVTALAKNNRLSHVNPIEKIALTLIPIIIIGFSDGFMLPLFNTLVFVLLHRKYKHSYGIVYKYTLGIVTFAAVSCITFVFDYGIWYCVMILLKSVSAGLSLTFLALTTPLDDVLALLVKIPFLRDVCDIAKSMERFLIIIEDEAYILYKTIESRGGFSSFALKIKNTGKLGAALFIHTTRRWQEIKDAIHSRCYTGKMYYLQPEYRLSAIRMALISIYIIVLVVGCFFGI